MPPSYKPIQVQAPQGLTADSFAVPSLSWEDASKTQALLRAQQISNEANQIQLEQRQRQQEQQNQYDLGLSGVADADEGLKIAQRIALEQGDLDTAIRIENSQRERRSAQPLSAAQRQFFGLGAEVPEGLTEKDLALKGAMDRGSSYSRQVSETIDKRQDDLQSLSPGGFAPVIDEQTGQGPNKLDGKLFTQTVKAHSQINGLLDSLEESLRKGGGNDPMSQEFALQKQILGQMAIAFKQKNEFGAALTPNEQALNNSILPTILAREDVGVADALMATGLGRDPFQAIANMRGMLSQDFDQQASIYKFRPLGGVGLPEAQSGTSFRIPTANQPARVDRGGLPPLSNYTPEELSYKEQYKQRARALRGQ